MEHKELFLSCCEGSALRTGAGVGSAYVLPWDDPVFNVEENMVRKIKRIEWDIHFVAAGAGYAYMYDFMLERNAVSPNLWNVDYFSRTREGSRKNVIYTKRIMDSDSYLYAAIIGGRSQGANWIEYPDGFEPVVLGKMTFHNQLRMYYDSVGGRAWTVYNQVVIHYFTELVAPKLYAEYSRQYRVRQ